MKIDEQLKKRVTKLARKQGLKLVLLFGSQVAGKTYKHSDVDICIMADKTYSSIELAGLIMEFSRVLRLRDIELTDLRQGTPLLLEQIAKKISPAV